MPGPESNLILSTTVIVSANVSIFPLGYILGRTIDMSIYGSKRAKIILDVAQNKGFKIAGGINKKIKD